MAIIRFDKLKVTDLDQIKLPKMYNVHQEIPSYRIDDPVAILRDKLNSGKTKLNNIINSGDRVAISVGSRGINRQLEILKVLLDNIRAVGGIPFIVPAMGSHGNASPSGQLEVLSSYGIKEDDLKIEIDNSLDTVFLGRTSLNSYPVYFAKSAFESDHIILLNRIKVHTDYSGKYESGILKMLAIGLGKDKGASALHSYGMDNFPVLIPEVAEYILDKTSVSIAIGLLEDGNDELSEIGVWTPDSIIFKEAEMLKRQKGLLAELPFPEIDLLIIDEMGKDISGAGVDPNIVGRLKEVKSNIKFIYVKDLTEASHGNAAGIGLVDFISNKLFKKIDFAATYNNLIASRVISNAKIPMVIENDEVAIKIALKATFSERELYCSAEKARVVRIKNTKKLKDFQISKYLLEFVKKNNKLSLKEEVI